jgi:hypothetical protein
VLLQPRGSRTILVLLGVGALLAATIAVLTLGPSAPSRGTIEVVSVPSGAEVRIDGPTITQPTPLVITDVDPARKHHLAVGKKSYDPWESDVSFEGAIRQVRLQAILIPQLTTIELSSMPAGAEALVNGRFAGITPTTLPDLQPNEEVVIELRLRGYRAAQKRVNPAGKRVMTLSIPLEKAR